MSLNLPSSLDTTQPYIPTVLAGSIGKLVYTFSTLAALNTAVTNERSNIAASLPIWPDGHMLPRVATEGGAQRMWSVSGQHARNVWLPGAKAPIALGADANVVTSVSTTPTGGADGDLAFNPALGVYFLRASGVWPSGIGYAIATVAGPRLLCCTRNRPPLYDQAFSGTNSLQRVRRTSSSQATWSDIQVTYVGYVLYGAEVQATTPFTLRASITYLGVDYPVMFSGSRDVLLGGSVLLATGTVPGLTLPPDAVFYENTRRILAAPGHLLISTEGDGAFGEFAYGGSDNSLDYTTGVRPGDGALGTFTVNSSGTITGLTVTAGGRGYAGPNASVQAFDPDTGVHATTLIANVGVTSGAVNVGVYGGALVNTTGWGPNTRPVLEGGGTGGGMYHAAAISGTSSNPNAKAWLCVGDSNGLGYGASDAVGDENRCFGIFERALSNREPMGMLAFPGQYAGNWANGESAYPLTIPMYRDLITDVLIQAAGNDVGGGNAFATIIQNAQTLGVNWRARNKRVTYATSVPRTTGPWTSAAAQVPLTPFLPGGVLDLYNEAVRRGLYGLHSALPVVLAYEAAVDPGAPNKWRSDLGVGYTLDGSHPDLLGLRIISDAMSRGTPAPSPNLVTSAQLSTLATASALAALVARVTVLETPVSTGTPHKAWSVYLDGLNSAGIGFMELAEVKFSKTVGSGQFATTSNCTITCVNGYFQSYDPTQLVDGDTTTGFVATTSSNRVIFNFATPQAFDQITLVPITSGNGASNAPVGIRLEVNETGSDSGWTNLLTNNTVNWGTDSATIPLVINHPAP